MQTKGKILFLGVKNVGELALRTLIKNKAPIAAVISGEGADNAPIIMLAEKYGIAAYRNPEVNNRNFINHLKSANIKVGLNFSYPVIFKKCFLDIFPYGCINFHPAILPFYRGRFPTVWPIFYGDEISGYTMHYVDEGIDTGNIIDILKVKINPLDTGYSLYERLVNSLPDLIKKHLSGLAFRKLKAIAQEHSQSLYFSKLPNDGQIDWRWNARKIIRFIRAVYHPIFKSAFIRKGNKDLQVLEASLCKIGGDKNLFYKAGNVFIFKGKAIISCKDGYLELKKIRINGKEMFAKKMVDYIRNNFNQ